METGGKESHQMNESVHNLAIQVEGLTMIWCVSFQLCVCVFRNLFF